MTEVDLLDLYDRASTWTLAKVRGAVDKLDSQTPCDDWDARSLLNHMLDTQRYFTGTARGEDVSLPCHLRRLASSARTRSPRSRRVDPTSCAPSANPAS